MSSALSPMRSPPRHMPGAYWWGAQGGSAQTRLYSAHRQHGKRSGTGEPGDRGPAAVPRGRFPVCHDVPPCCGDPRRTRRQPHGRRRQRRRESQDSLDLPRRRNGRVRCHQSADSGRLQTHRLLRFLNHHYRPGGAVRRVSPSARGRGHPLRRAVGRQRGKEATNAASGSRSRVRRDQAGRHLLLQRYCARPSSTRRPESGRSASAQTFP